jgi:UDP:flavonoid glycosyltransferase YjiC (YdhE family)
MNSQDCRVVWSLTDSGKALLEVDPDTNPKFWVKNWLPQIEVINHPAVKCGITHAGWGGLLEFLGAGKPVITFPHFFDQPGNSRLLVEAKAAIELCPGK